MFHQTTTRIGISFDKAMEDAESQEDIIMTIIRDNPKYAFSPEDIHRYFSKRTPLTSIRRALTDLTSKKLLIKTNKLKMGSFGRFAHTWKLNEGVIYE